MKSNNLLKIVCFKNPRILTKPAALLISALFIISALSFFGTGAIQVKAATNTFGDATVETRELDQMPKGYISAIRFTAPENGAVSMLTYYCSGASVGKTKCFVYNSDSKGSPNQLLASSIEVGVNTVGMWRDYAVPQFNVVAGAKYWLAFMGNVQLYTPITSGEANQWSWTGAGALVYPNAPSTFIEGGFSNYKGSIYVTYISASPMPTASPSPTPIVVPSPSPTPTLTPKQTATPTPTPSVYSSSVNLAPINDGKWYTDSTWQKCPAVNVYYDTTTTHKGAPTWRITPGNNFGADHENIPVKGGDHVVMSCWIKTTGVPKTGNGARIGIDFYGQYGGTWARIGAANSEGDAAAGKGYPNYNAPDEMQYIVPYGRDWTLVVWDFVVPSTFMSDGGYGMINGHQVPKGVYCTITNACVWVQLFANWGSTQGTSTAYFSDFQFCVNP